MSRENAALPPLFLWRKKMARRPLADIIISIHWFQPFAVGRLEIENRRQSVYIVTAKRGVFNRVFHNGKIYVAAEEKIAEHICSQLDRIGKYACSAKIADPSVIVSNERRFEIVGLIISSNRLDCYVSAIAGISRERAASEIKAGNIRLNGVQVYEATKRLSLGDRLSVRG